MTCIENLAFIFKLLSYVKTFVIKYKMQATLKSVEISCTIFYVMCCLLLVHHKKKKKKKELGRSSNETVNCSEMWSGRRKGSDGKRKRGYFNVQMKIGRKSKTGKPSTDICCSANTEQQDGCEETYSIPHCPWGGTVGDLTLSNTCTIDNLLFGIHVLICRRNDIRNWLQACDEPVAKTLLEVSTLFGKGEWSAGKLCWITSNNLERTGMKNIDLYGTESDKFVKYFGTLQQTVCVQKCSKTICTNKSSMSSNEILLPLVNFTISLLSYSVYQL